MKRISSLAGACALLALLLSGHAATGAQEPVRSRGAEMERAAQQRVSSVAGRDALAAELTKRLGHARFMLTDLALPPEESAPFQVEVPLAGITRTLELSPYSLRAPGFRLRVSSASGELLELEPAAPATFRGTLDGEPGAVVIAARSRDGLTARVFSGSAAMWTIRPVRALVPSAPAGLHVIFSGEDEAPVACGVAAPDAGQVSGSPPGAVPALPPAVPPAGARHWIAENQAICQKLAQIAFDADFEYYQDHGSSVDEVVATIESHMNVVDFFYARDVRITHEITEIVVRTAPFYFPTSGGDLLDQFRAEWNANMGEVPRDLAHLMTGKPGSLIEYGGLAWVGVVCTNSAYGWSMDGANIVGHEIGHNWGAGHCHDVSPCNNMCGACYYIAPNTRDIILAHRNSRTCLEPARAYPTPLPPYAYPERLTLRKDELDGLGSLALDVLGNDDDGNCNPLRLEGFYNATSQGGTVALSGGTGPDGRDELLYTPPATPFVGDDNFQYFVGDGTGQQTAGEVVITVRPLELTGYWKLDETAGTLAADSAGGDHDGTAAGAPVWTSGPHGGALEFDGVNDSVAISPLHLNSGQATITAWIRRNGQQGSYKGLVFSRDGSTVAGLHFGGGNGLRYTWNDDPTTYNWNSGLIVPDGQWVFAALVVEPQQATLYLHDGVSLQSAVNPVAHAPEAFDGETRLGWDAGSATRRFTGALDDVRVYDHALSAAAIAELHTLGGQAAAPRPADGGRLIDPAYGLRWVPGLGADSHDVYFGSDYAGVRDATTASAEYQGSFATAAFAPGGLASGVEYFWRVDEVVGASVVRGHVWQFSLAELSHWKLDETSGTTAADSAGGLDAEYVSGPLLGQPGATPALGTSVELDGVNDRVRIPALNLNDDHVTITAWVKRNGDQSDFAGIVFSRAANTVAGLNVGDHNELRYHWDGGNWPWDSALVLPDGQWAFVALVIQPEQATIYLGDGGPLQFAVDAASHAPEEFDGNTLIGRDNNGGARYFRGNVDDVRILRAALSPQDVQELYANSQ